MKLDRSKYLESRSLKPRNILISIVIINVVLGLIVLAFPSSGIALGAWELKFASVADFNGSVKKDSNRVEIEKVLEGITPVEDMSPTDQRTIAVSLQVKEEVKKSSFYDSASQNIDQIATRSLQLPPNNPNALDAIIDALYNDADKRLVRILHYGDSQLEGDRISDYFRNRMQTLFGGSGPGCVLPLEPAAGMRRSVYVTQSKNFRKKAVYIKGAEAEENRYGMGCASFVVNGRGSKFLGYEYVTDSNGTDSIGKFSGKNPKTFIRISNGTTAYSNAKSYNNIGLLYNNKSHFKVRVTSDNFVKDYTIPPSDGLGFYKWDLATSKKLHVEFTEGKYPEVYGITLDGDRGVAVDNFAMRGSAAIGFSVMDTDLFRAQCKQTDVNCILLQYGINVVPNVRSDYTYYKKILIKQLAAIKKANPNVTIIVIGPSDMSRNKKGIRESYTNIPLIRDAMREAAFETGCAFWDLYEVMGGKNSMVSWVQKGLGQKDYTHFTFKGAKYVGELLYEAFLEKIYDKYPMPIDQ